MIAEIYGVMRDGMQLDAGVLRIFDDWNNDPLKSYLIEITGSSGGNRY